MALQEARDLAAPELHRMFGLRRRRPRAVATTEFTTLGITQRRAAKIFDVSERHFRRWRSGDRQIPTSVAVLLRLVAMGRVSLADVELAAGLVINGSTSPEPPVERAPAPAKAAAALTPVKIDGDAGPGAPAPPVEPVSAPASLARVETVTLVDPGVTTAIYTLTAKQCRWPIGDPRDRDFHFCCDPTLEPPYCPRHRDVAFLAPRTGSGHGVRVGFVAHGGPATSGVFSATRAAVPVHEASPC